MSYDLYFRKRNKEKITLDQFNGYFQNRARYKVENEQAFYQNEDTGVYFIFEYNDHSKIDPAESPADISPVYLSINLFRSHIFGLEAEPEISVFVKHFDLLVHDPQIDGISGDEYDSRAFLRGYDIGNKFSYESFSKSDPAVLKNALSSAEIERCWDWNYHRSELQAEVGEDVFVPRIFFHRIEGKVKSAVLWSEAIPTTFPKVDTVVIFRQSLAPSHFFKRKKDDYTIVDPSQIAELLEETTCYKHGDFKTIISTVQCQI